MPTYTYRCPHCGLASEAVRAVRDHDAPMPCDCGADMRQTIESAPMVNASFLGSARNPGYRCVVSDQWVSSAKQRRNIEREHNLIPAG